MSKKQTLFLGFAVIVIAVIFTMAGCATLKEIWDSTSNGSEFPSAFIGTWKRDNFNNTLTFSSDTFKDSSQIPGYVNLMSISGDLYTLCWDGSSRNFTITIRLVNGNLVVSGDSGDGEYNWNGTWRRINASTNSAEASGVRQNSAGELKNYLDGQPDNGPDKPIAIAITANDSTLKDIVDVIKSSDKFVSLNLTGNTLTTIGEDAFKDCKKLTKITIPGSVKNFDQGAFIDCTSLTEINVDSGNTLLSSVDGVLYTKDKTLLVIFPQGYKVTDVSISSSVAPDAFYGSRITSVTLEGGYFDLSKRSIVSQRIYEGAFINCSNLTRVRIDNSGSGAVELEKGSFDGDLYDLWDKATLLRSNSGITGRDGSFIGTFTRPNGTSTTWTLARR
jgi:hypothetical protein